MDKYYFYTSDEELFLRIFCLVIGEKIFSIFIYSVVDFLKKVQQQRLNGTAGTFVQSPALEQLAG